MHEDTAAADHTQPHVFALDRAPLAEQVAELRRELDETFDSLNWQERCNARLRGLLYTCQVEGRAPRDVEIRFAMAYRVEPGRVARS
ncbi:hypothetical protein ISN75_02595 [Dyella marensis]|uniref:hypothetical protein n=1 Tax=Dyella marensis TaxID=500610 RepID=UPI0031DF412C